MTVQNEAHSGGTGGRREAPAIRSDKSHDPRPPSPSGGGGDGGVVNRPGLGGAGRPDMGWTELVVAGVLFAVLLFVSAFGWLVVSVVGEPDAPNPVSLVALGGAAMFAAAILAWSVRIRRLAALGIRATSTAWVLAAVAAGALTRLTTSGAVLGYQQLTGGPADPWTALDLPVDYQPTVGMVLVAGLLVPLGAELLFRGVGYGALRRYGVWVAAPVSALLFASVHFTIAGIVSALVLGIVTALLYERSKSLWPAVAAHATFVLTAFAIAVLL